MELATRALKLKIIIDDDSFELNICINKHWVQASWKDCLYPMFHFSSDSNYLSRANLVLREFHKAG